MEDIHTLYILCLLVEVVAGVAIPSKTSITDSDRYMETRADTGALVFQGVQTPDVGLVLKLNIFLCLSKYI